MQSHSTEYPPELPTRWVVPGILQLDRVVWKATGAHVWGSVGGVAFAIAVPSLDLLNRKRFAFHLWRFKKLLPILPDIVDWQEAIRLAERAGQ